MQTTSLLTDKEIIAKHDPGCRHRASIELAITRRVIKDLLADGYSVSVHDGEEVTKSDDIQVLVNAVFAVDEATIQTHSGTTGKRSFVFLVMGNDGSDIICDYGTSLEPVMEPIHEWIEEQIDAGTF